jgi:hypothetical protein
MAIAGSSAPDRMVNVSGSSVNGKTYKEVVQDVVDYLSWCQTDLGERIGGWNYIPTNKDEDKRSDNSITGWVTLGLEFAWHKEYKFQAVIPQFVKTNLNSWVDYIQNDGSGGSGYDSDRSWINVYKTAALLQQMAFLGDKPDTLRVQHAVNYLVANWNARHNYEGMNVTSAGVTLPTTQDKNIGWRGDPSDHVATYSIMKGLQALGINTIGGNIDWYQDLCDAIVEEQKDDGSWQQGIWDGDSGGFFSSALALLTLERVAPPPITVW